MVQCVQCGQELIADARYCAACGALQVPARCARCGFDAHPGARFCAACGTPLYATSREQVQAPAIVVPSATSGDEANTPTGTTDAAAPKARGWSAAGGWLYEAFDNPTSRVYQAVNLVSVTLVFASVAAITLESIPELGERHQLTFGAIEWVIVALFTAEYALNFYVAPRKWRYVLSFGGIVDLLAVLPTYLSIFDLRVLRLLRIARVLRVLKLSKVSLSQQPGDSVGWALVADVQLFFTTLFAAVMIAATLVWYAERGIEGTTFTHIPAAMWWAIGTLTTGPYGDMIPITPLGRAVASATTLAGMALTALLVAILLRALARQRPA